MRSVAYCLVLLFAVMAVSCQKETGGQGDPTGPTGTTGNNGTGIQRKWFLVNIIVYSNYELTGPSFFGYAGNGVEYYDFRTDGKLYAYAANTFDTAVYNLLPDSTLLVNEIRNGIPATKPDTAKVRKLTADTLIFSVRNPANDYGKFTFRK